MNANLQPLPAIVFDNTYARLPERFYAPASPGQMPAPRLIRINEPLANTLGIDVEYLGSPEGVDILVGNRIPEGAEPLAMAYSGHQFGGWAPQLGDGRAMLIGEILGRDGIRRDLHLKGSGRTAFSRGGDGRAPLGPVLREYIVSEAMHGLGIPTTRSLAAVFTGEKVRRETLLPGAVLARVAQSHVRVGTFEYFAARNDIDALRTLADYIIARHYPALADHREPYLALLAAIGERQARVVAQWMAVGFIHGVMNTDNMQVAGETIDYGPCAFMDTYDPATVFSSIDYAGRYAYRNQPQVAYWNLACLAQALLPLLGANDEEALERAKAALDNYPAHYEQAISAAMQSKLGLGSEQPGDAELRTDLLHAMGNGHADFTLAFRALSALDNAPGRLDSAAREHFDDPSAFDAWLERWRVRLASENSDATARQTAMRAVNPFLIPRNHCVEAAIADALEGNLGTFERLVAAVQDPFTPLDSATHDTLVDLTLPPRPEQVVRQTFCGT